MEKAAIITLILFLFFFLHSTSDYSVDAEASEAATWCVAKPSTDNAVLNENIQYACSIVDCSELQPPNGKCFHPDNLLFHASAAMNIYYQANGRKIWTCYFNNTGLITITDPSTDGCSFWQG
ncbi:CBM43-containing protein [Zostera marina]|uniref:CBM43-containing protein n=1 Tax=Zostera marina TaxID=29655 RepID=A0A0K9PIS1_ZOSMR|nr:CBM43-containing protein [Zostera marina]